MAATQVCLVIASPIGPLRLASDGAALIEVRMQGEWPPQSVGAVEPLESDDAPDAVLAEAARAVGWANGANPLPIIVPCHRVIGADGAMTGFGGGVARKRWLLAHEARCISPQADLFGSCAAARSGQPEIFGGRRQVLRPLRIPRMRQKARMQPRVWTYRKRAARFTLRPRNVPADFAARCVTVRRTNAAAAAMNRSCSR